MVDRIVGFRNGVAKKANIVIVKVPCTVTGDVRFDSRLLLEALNLVVEDIYVNKIFGKTVVNYSAGMNGGVIFGTQNSDTKLTSG